MDEVNKKLNRVIELLKEIEHNTEFCGGPVNHLGDKLDSILDLLKERMVIPPSSISN